MAVGPASTPEPASTPRTGSTAESASTPDSASEVSRIRKGITMRVTVYIEGEDAPAHDFVQTGMQIINKLFSAQASAAAAPYTVAVKKIEPLEGSDDSDEG
jgi:hypothetical protein